MTDYVANWSDLRFKQKTLRLIFSKRKSNNDRSRSKLTRFKI